MKTKTVEVKSRRGKRGEPAEVVGRPLVQIAETWSEACQLAGSEDKALGIFNTQWETNAKNKARALATAELSDKKAETMALQWLSSDRGVMRELAACATDAEMEVRKAELLAAKIAELQAEYKVQEAAAAEEAEGDEAASS